MRTPRRFGAAVGIVIVTLALNGCGEAMTDAAGEDPAPVETSMTTATVPLAAAVLVDPPPHVEPMVPSDQLLALASDTGARARAASVLGLTPDAGAEFAAETGHPIESWVVVDEIHYRTINVVLAVIEVVDGEPAVRAAARVSQGNNESAGYQLLERADFWPAFEDLADGPPWHAPLIWELVATDDGTVSLEVVPMFCDPAAPLTADAVEVWVWEVAGGVALHAVAAEATETNGTAEACAGVEPTVVEVTLPPEVANLPLLDPRSIPPAPIG